MKRMSFPGVFYSNMKTPASLFFAISVFACLQTQGHATVVPHKNLKQLVDESAVVLVGTVTSIAFEPISNGDMFTEVRLQYLKPIVGKRQIDMFDKSGLRLSFFGGLRTNGTVATITGMPQLHLGETYLVFLRRGEWTLNPITGWHQGLLRVLSDGGDSHVLMNTNGGVLMDVKDHRLVYKDVPDGQPQLNPQVPLPGKTRVRELTIEQHRQLLKELTDSPYREDSAKQLEELDRQRVNDVKEPTPAEATPTGRVQRLQKILGGTPMSLNKFIAHIEGISRMVGSESEFHLQPTPRGLGLSLSRN